MKRILFVDDEPDVIQALRRMLWPLRKQWKMTFVSSGQDALQSMEKSDFDVIVTDMRMPEMNGAELLTAVKQQYPDVVRIILSGHSDEETILRSVGIAHQYLAKPCDADALQQTIARACALRDLLNSSDLKRIVSRLNSLPSLPDLYQEIVEQLQSDDPSINKIGKIIEKDIGMTAKILQLVNSAFFGLPRQVSDAKQAVSLLGIDTIKGLVCTIHIFTQFDNEAVQELGLKEVWDHSMNVGAYARLIGMAHKAEQTMIDQGYLAGNLHDVGKLVLAQNQPAFYSECIKLSKAEGIPLQKAELEVFGATHADIGAYLLGLWGFDDPIIEAIAFHHRPSDSCTSEFTPVVAVHIANAFAQAENKKNNGSTLQNKLDVKWLSSLNLSQDLPGWMKISQKAIAEARK